MVHNGIEYGLMQAYAEGYELLAAKDIVNDLPGTFRAWQKGTVVRSWLLDLMVKALDEDPGLASIDDYVEDSGEGRWTVEEAIANAVPAPAITAALFARFSSREDNSPAMKMVSALRHQFGGHAPGRPSGPGDSGSPETGVYLEKLSLTDFRSYAQVDLSLRAGGDRARGLQRHWQNQPDGSHRVPRHAELAPGQFGCSAVALRNRTRDDPGQTGPG